MEFDDGTYGIIDCKFQGRDSNKSEFYSPQLEAYAFALENPVSGSAKEVSVLGLLVWSPRRPVGDPDSGFHLELNSSWYPIKRDPAALERRLTQFIAMISGPTPNPKENCDLCKFITDRREIFGEE